ncbi:MAG: hypothetical protein GWN01_12875 [Nitrosopumilaceae archaeon]|nr:hypothetical protein [Nitrosopumilaceae archaeon]NIV66480.1 hypothetical protein [Nitrosopumilaceae archaeon]NIX62359.1 hypothetical protein [Nitrosopumilaceae archaeon]
MAKNNSPKKLENILVKNNIPQTAIPQIKKTVKVISSMAGIEKENIELKIKDESVKIKAKNGSRNYHAMVQIKPKE